MFMCKLFSKIIFLKNYLYVENKIVICAYEFNSISRTLYYIFKGRENIIYGVYTFLNYINEKQKQF
jgi:hypothetical protein